MGCVFADSHTIDTTWAGLINVSLLGFRVFVTYAQPESRYLKVYIKESYMSTKK